MSTQTDLAVFHQTAVPMIVFEHGTLRPLTANNAAADLYDWEPDALQTKDLAELIASEDAIRLYAELARARDRFDHPNVFRHRRLDGQLLFVELSCSRLKWGDDDAELLTVSDVTENRLLHSRLFRLLDASPDLICTVDSSLRFNDVSMASASILGFEPSEMIGRPFWDFIHPADRERSLMEAERLLGGGETAVGFENRFAHKEGNFRWLLWSSSYSPVDELIHCVGRDITERKALESQLADSTLHDQTTGLANRALMLDHLRVASTAFTERGSLFAVLLVKVERLDFLSAALGSDAVNIAMSTFARRTLRAVADAGTVGRVAVDQFAILLSGATETEATGMAMRLRQVLTEPIDLAGEEVSLNASVGVLSAQPGMSLNGETLLQDATVAAGRARVSGQNIETFDASFRQALRERIQLESELRHAIDHEEFYLLYQPVVNMKTGKLEKLEALLRWSHPTRGPVAPNEFIDAAEDTGLIVPLGEWVMRTAAAQVAEWRSEFHEVQPKVAVNVAMQQLVDGTFVDVVRDCLERNGLPGSSLVVELTERAYMTGDDRIHEAVLALRLLHIELAIDDFGTGYSSLSCLKHLPLNVIKIDKSFVDGVTISATDRALISGIISFAHALGLTVVAEGVETNEQVKALKQLGCDLAQGYALARPMTPDDVARRFLGIEVRSTV